MEKSISRNKEEIFCLPHQRVYAFIQIVANEDLFQMKDCMN